MHKFELNLIFNRFRNVFHIVLNNICPLKLPSITNLRNIFGNIQFSL